MFTDLRSLDLAGKKVLVRCDFNVPLENGAIADPGRIDASLDTIRYILQQGGNVRCSVPIWAGPRNATSSIR